MSEGRAGDNVGILLRGIRRDEVERGQVRENKSPTSNPILSKGLKAFSTLLRALL